VTHLKVYFKHLSERTEGRQLENTNLDTTLEHLNRQNYTRSSKYSLILIYNKARFLKNYYAI